MKHIITLLTFLICSFGFTQIDYNTQIQPIFDANCNSCHWGGGGYTGSGLGLANYDEVLLGGISGDVVNNGLLEEYITTGYMPFDDSWSPYNFEVMLSDDEIELISQWISEGALEGGLTPCQEEVANATGMIGEFVPDCEEDGSYAPIQCNSSTGYCWCVGEDGNEIPGTAIPSWVGTPDCGGGCISDIDQDGICEDDCGDDMPTLIFDCACSFFNPYTYTVFYTTINEEYCEIWEECYCECINDVNENGICDEEEVEGGCTLSDGSLVANGWFGPDTGDNWCNTCFCDNGILGCTEMDCGGGCISDIDQDGICEDDCEELEIIIEDCECSFFDPNTYTVSYTIVDEASCTLIETCYCECINDINNNGICDEDEEGCWEDGEFYDVFSQLFVDECNYYECIVSSGFFWSDLMTIDGCEDDCPCINPDWVDPFAVCTMEYNPVIGCDSMIYSNPCIAQTAGLTSWVNDWTGDVTILEWDCEETECIAELIPGCMSITLWDPVCGCDGVTYSNSADAACNNIFEYTVGECGGEGEGCWEEGEFYCIGCELIVDTCNYYECLDENQWSDLITIDDCGEGEGCWEEGEFYCIGCELIVDTCNYYECLDENQWSDLITIDDCGGDIEGCTDPTACNFMNSATIDNNSCVYDGDPECEDCGTILDFNNYGDNEVFAETYYAPPGLIITINFSGSTESCCDHVYVNGVEYDGELDGIVIGDEVLEIEWTTDFSVNSASGYGWSAELICEEPISGCTQPYADNYNPDANTDDGSCILDCEYFLSYDSYMNDYATSSYYCGLYVSQGTYTIEQAISFGYNCDCVILGCMDENAINYDENATIEANCACEYEEVCTIVSVTGGSFPTEVSWEIENENGDIVLNGGAPYCENFCFEDGCYTIHMNDSYGDGWNNATLSIDDYNYTFTTGSYAIAPFGYNNNDCIIEGCTNSLADNYNEEANYDDGSCEYGCEYLLTYESYQDLGFDNSVSNYYCAYYLELGYYTIEEMINMGYNCDCVIVGCTDEEATNYDEEAFIDDCTCVYANDCPSISFNSTDSSLGWEINNMEGETILEYNTNGQEVGSYCGNYCFEDGCYIINMTSLWGGGWYQTTLDIGDESFTLPTGSEGMAAFAYNTDMNCQIGCTDPDASNYNPEAILDDGSCVLFGCTITTACNYNPDATAFDGSCYYCYMDDCNTYPNDLYDCEGNCYDEDNNDICDADEIAGCIDANACNYEPNATSDDGSCEYPEQYYDCYGNCLNDIDGDEVCNEIDNCPSTYNPNQEDFDNDGIGDGCDGIDLNEYNSFEWSVYPNPFKNYTTLKFSNPTNTKFKVEIISLSGQSVYNQYTWENEHQIRNKFTSGYYIIQLESDKNIVRETLIIQ